MGVKLYEKEYVLEALNSLTEDEFMELWGGGAPRISGLGSLIRQTDPRWNYCYRMNGEEREDDFGLCFTKNDNGRTYSFGVHGNIGNFQITNESSSEMRE